LELVYLWIDKYKNIEKQGFCFSPKYKCSYDPDKKELNIEEKENYIPLFSEEDDIKVTAIVGKNGSGKSSIQEYIYKLLYNNSNKSDDKNNKNSGCLILKIDNEYCYLSNGKVKIKCNKKIQPCKEKNNIKENIYSIFIDFTILKNEILNDIDNYKKNYALEPTRLFKTGTQTTKIESVSMESYLKVKTLLFYYYLQTNNYKKIIEELNFPKIENIIFKYNSIKRTLEGLKNIFFGLNYSDESQKNEKNSGGENNQNSFIEQFPEEVKKFINEIYEIYNNTKKEKNEKEEEILKKIKEIINEQFSINTNKKNTNKETKLSYDSFCKILNKQNDQQKIFNLLEFLHTFIDIDIEFENQFKFNSLSTGQQIIIGYLGIIFADINYFAKDKDTILIFFDEVETGFHPSMQKNFLKLLLDVFQKIFKNKKFHFIFLTHSPFILSDIPKENIIFLKDGKNVSDEIDIHTFGANIHTLLSHAFFMEDGLIGEFAKEKINDVIKFLNDGENSKIKNKEEAKYIINMIGEPFIQFKLLEKYELKYSNSKSKIDTRIKILEEEIKRLKNVKNKNK